MKTNMSLKIQTISRIAAMLLLMIVVFPYNLHSQSSEEEMTVLTQTGSDYEIVMKSGDIFSGTVISVRNASIEMEAASGATIVIPLSEVKSVKLISGDEKVLLKYKGDNTSRVRYFITPSGYMLKRGEAYYQNSYLVGNIWHVGISDNFSIGGAFDFISLSLGRPVLTIMPRYGFEISPKLRASVGITYVHSFVENWGGLGYGFANLTVGSPDSNLTFGGGLGFSSSEGFVYSSSLLTLSGMSRISNTISLMTENYVLTSNGHTEFLSVYGLRFHGKKLSADIGLVNNNHIAEIFSIGLPYVGFAVKF